MGIIKLMLLATVFIISVLIGLSISKKYSIRVSELYEIQRALNIFEEKIKYTYEPIPDVFEEISTKCIESIASIFKNASKQMKLIPAGEAWENALDNSITKLNKDDIDTLKGMAKMLGRTDLDGQVNEIRLTQKFITTKIKEAEIQKNKNEKLYKTLGIMFGLTIVIVLI